MERCCNCEEVICNEEVSRWEPLPDGVSILYWEGCFQGFVCNSCADSLRSSENLVSEEGE